MAIREDAMIVNALVRQALTSAQEVMSENGLNAVREQAALLDVAGRALKLLPERQRIKFILSRNVLSCKRRSILPVRSRRGA